MSWDVNEMTDSITKETINTVALNPTTPEEKVEKEEDKKKDYVPYGVISFAELEKMQRTERVAWEAREVADSFSQMAYNIISTPEIDRETAMNNLVTELQGKMEEINKINRGVVKETTHANDATPEDVPDSPELQKSDLMLWKDVDGLYKWVTVYSNKYRDEDRVPEIISEKSHKAFEYLVDEGIVPAPELWLWHIPGTAWGKSDMVTYSDGFSIAFGHVLPGFEFVAEGLMKAMDEGDDIAVSHGMPGQFIVRSKEDPTVIDFHITREISVLPRSSAANKLTGFVVFKEEGDSDMPLPDEKKQWLMAKFDLDPDTISKLETGLAKQAEAADKAGIESKESDDAKAESTPDETTEQKEEESTDPVLDVENKKEEKVDETASKEDDKPLSRDEIAEAMNAVVGVFRDGLKEISDRLNDMESQVKELQVENTQETKERIEQIPTDSLVDMVHMNIIGKDGARVDGRNKLAKDGPEETEPITPSATGVPVIDRLMAGSQVTASDG